jgi:hypothetical protein
MTSRWPLNIWLWKNEAGSLVPGCKLADFTTTMNNFDEARRLICDKLNHEDYACGVIWALPEETEGERIELHYRAFDDPFRGRIVTGGMCTAKEADEFVAELKKEYKKRVFTPNELYALKPIDSGCLEWLEKWLSEENICLHNYEMWDQIEKTGLVKLRYLANEVMGSDESFEVATIWFASNPIAVVTHTGEDNNDRYITDVEGWYKMIVYLRSFMVPDEEEKPTMVDPNKPLHWLTEPDGYHTLHDFYDVERQEKKAKVLA